MSRHNLDSLLVSSVRGQLQEALSESKREVRHGGVSGRPVDVRVDFGILAWWHYDTEEWRER